MAKWIEKTEVDIDAFWTPKDDVPIEGTVIDARQIRDADGNRRLMWVIELSAPTLARKKGEEKGSNYDPGAIIGVGHRSKLMPLAKDFMNLEQFEVRIAPNGQRKLSGGKTMWNLRYAMQGGTVRRVALTPGQVVPVERQLGTGAPSQEEGEDDTPF